MKPLALSLLLVLAACEPVAPQPQPRELGAPVARRVVGHVLLEDVAPTPPALDVLSTAAPGAGDA